MKHRFLIVGLTIVGLTIIGLTKFGYAQHIGQSSTQYNGSIYHLGGNLGIGTTTPNFSLTIRKDAAGAEGAVLNLVNSQYANSTGSSSAIRFQTGIDYRFAKISAIQRETGVIDRLAFGMVNYNDVYNEILTIKENGRIGIGTTSPMAKITSVAQTNKYSAFFGYGSESSGDIGGVGFITDGSSFYKITTDYWTTAKNFPLILGTYYNNSNQLVLAISGNVGIGTNNPTAKLAVNGDIKAKEVNVTLEGWPDFVFKSNYTLRPLSEVEQFIKANNHLPEIPSEAEVKENGVSLGEMNAKLLQKVEELTLYLIEQQKLINAQNNKIQDLENKINSVILK